MKTTKIATLAPQMVQKMMSKTVTSVKLPLFKVEKQPAP